MTFDKVLCTFYHIFIHGSQRVSTQYRYKNRIVYRKACHTCRHFSGSPVKSSEHTYCTSPSLLLSPTQQHTHGATTTTNIDSHHLYVWSEHVHFLHVKWTKCKRCTLEM